MSVYRIPEVPNTVPSLQMNFSPSANNSYRPDVPWQGASPDWERHNPMKKFGSGIWDKQTFGWGYTPDNFYNSVANKSYSNQTIDRLSGMVPELQNMFAQAAQQYSNLYSSPGFKNNKYLVEGLNQGQTSDFLQAAYNTMIKRLDDAYAL